MISPFGLYSLRLDRVSGSDYHWCSATRAEHVMGKTLSILMLAGCRSTGVIESDVSQYWPAHDALVKVSMSAPAGQGPYPAVILMHG